MKILLINDHMHGGGVENVVQQLIRYLHQNPENEITFVTMDGSRELDKDCYPSEIRFIPYDFWPAQEYRRFGLKWLIHRLSLTIYHFFLSFPRYDVVLAMKEGYASIAGTHFRAPKRYSWVHVDYETLYWTKVCYHNSKKREVACMRKYDRIVCVSNAVLNSVKNVIGDPGNLIVRMNPMNVDFIREEACITPLSLKKYYNLHHEKVPIFTTVGRLVEEKGYERLLSVCAELQKDFSFELWILGEGEKREALEKMIHENNLKQVVLWGEQVNPFPFIKAADWYVSSSFTESYGLAVQEALILGVPVIAANCPAFQECVSINEAILVPQTEKALYTAMKKVLSDPQIREKYVQGISKERTQENYLCKRCEEIEYLWKS